MGVGRRGPAWYIVPALLLVVFFLFLRPHTQQPPPILKGDTTIGYFPSAFDWSSIKHRHLSGSVTLPTGAAVPIPQIQHQFPQSAFEQDDLSELRRRAVKAAFQKSWSSYSTHAMFHDELLPLTGEHKDTLGGLGATLFDSLDTLWIMGLREEFHEAAKYAALFDFNSTTATSLSMFETTIRHLGGLISAYELSGEAALLSKAVEMGDMLYAGFNTPNRMPTYWLDLEKAKKGALTADDHQALASFGTLSMEFTQLARLTGQHKYYDAIDRVTQTMAKHQRSTRIPGMWPAFANLRTGHFESDAVFTLGGLADSAYEYLPKMFLLLSGREPLYEKLYRDAAEAIEKNLLFRPMVPGNDDILFSGDMTVDQNGNKQHDPETQHLTCFVGGMYALGGRIFEDKHHVDLATRLTNGCVYAYNAFNTGIMPEIFSMVACKSLDRCQWDATKWSESEISNLPPGVTLARDARYILRPEAIESVFVMYRITGRQEFRDAAWKMFEAIRNATETHLAFAAIKDVTVSGVPRKEDSMESFWLAETLKYFYLIFSPPNVISLDEYVFNTEAHPFRRWT